MFVEYRSASNLRKRNVIENRAATLSSGSGKKKVAPFGLSKGSGDDHLLIDSEEYDSHHHPLTGGHLATQSLPPKWVDTVDNINSVLVEIKRLMSVLNTLHSNRLGSVFGRDLESKESEIESITAEITDCFRNAERMLMKVGSATRQAGGEEATIGSNVQRSLAKKLQAESQEFRKMQRKYLRDVQAQKSGKATSDEDKLFGIIDIEEQAKRAELGGNLDGDMNTQQMALVDDLTEEVQSRDQEIAKIAESIQELSSIFKELAVLVIDQGTILDRIDYNMEAVVEHTKEGIEQLEKAEKQQKSSRPMKCIMCLLSVIMILLILLVLKYRRRH